MLLQTKIPLKKQPQNQIDYNSNVLLIGSCFSENIGAKFEYYKFQTLQNPFGILFHSKAIENLIEKSVLQKKYTEKEVFFHNERWHNFDAHSILSKPKKDVLVDTLNKVLLETEKQLKQASHIIITLGTSWIYQFLDTNTIVANCHKVPQKKFQKRLLSVEEIVQSLHNIEKLIRSINKNVSVIYTVSPVRHIKDGFVESTQSKAHLITAIHQYLTNSKNVFYFPSYEIMLDELRDYRFYTQDMLHPNQTAIDYIWEKFVNIWFSEASQKTMQEVATIQKGINHKPFNTSSSLHQKFLENLAKKKKNLLKDFPFIQF